MHPEVVWQIVREMLELFEAEPAYMQYGAAPAVARSCSDFGPVAS
jgi:hypothetical protein